MSANADEAKGGFMSDVVLSVTVFHTLAAIALFSMMIVGVIGAVQHRNPQ